MRKFGMSVALLVFLAADLAASAKFLDYRDYLVAGTPTAVAVADVNNDGIPDAIVGTAGGTNVLLGHRDGSFSAPISVARSGVWALAVADFNNDGKMDIAATILTNGTQLTLALGNGDGTFQPAQVLPAGCIDCYLAAADFDNDGNMDLAIASTSEATVLLGHGDGTFSTSPGFLRHSVFNRRDGWRYQ